MALARFCAVWRLHGRRQGFPFPSEYSLSSGYTRKADALCSRLSRNLIIAPVSLNRLSSGVEVFVLRRGFLSCSYNASGVVPSHAVKDAGCLAEPCSYKSTEISFSISGVRYMSSVKAPAGARQVSMKLTLLSPGFVYDPYMPRDPIPFWRRWFTPSGWRRTKEDLIMELKSAYAITRLRKVAGYSKKLFYQHALRLYKEINTSLANGDTSSLRKLVTEKMYSTLKNEIKRRDSMWKSVYWELVEPVVSIRTLRARMIALDKDDLDKAFVQLTLEITAKQRFEAYNAKGTVVSGDKTKELFTNVGWLICTYLLLNMVIIVIFEVLVRDIWVLERSLFHPGADWRLCSRILL